MTTAKKYHKRNKLWVVTEVWLYLNTFEEGCKTPVYIFIQIYHMEVDASQDSGALLNDNTDSMAAFFGASVNRKQQSWASSLRSSGASVERKQQCWASFLWRSSVRVSNGSNSSILTSC
jgi:hypothetical protein